MVETAQNRLKRLKIRAWRRGTKEMDLILGTYVDKHVAALDPAELDTLEALMDENDIDLYQWFTGQVAMPPEHREILLKIQGETKLF